MDPRIASSVYAALDAVNEDLAPDQRLPKEAETVLTGSHGGLDSLAMLDFISAVERELEQQAGITVSLYEDNLPTGVEDPFRSVGSVMRHIDGLLRRVAA